MRRSIILTGPMGSGKSSVIRLLSERLGYVAMDLDALIVEISGKSINKLFEELGEPGFRRIESDTLATLSCHEGVVLATGGGTVVSEQNRTMLHSIGIVVNLTATVDELAARLLDADDRPLLQSGEPLKQRIARIMAEREPFYADSDIRIDTTGKTLEDVVANILAFYENAQEAS